MHSTQGHKVYAKHNKFGIFLVPQSFLNWNGPPDQHHTLDTSSLDLKKLSHVKVGNKEAADKAAEEAAKEKMKRWANDEAKKARRKRSKTQHEAAAMAAMEEQAEVKAAAAVEKEKEAMAAAEIAMEHADPTKASKVEPAVQIRPGSASDSALGLHGWLRGRSSSLGGWPQWKHRCIVSRRCGPFVHSGGMLGLRGDHTCSIFLLTTRRGTALRASAPSSSLASLPSLVPSAPNPRPSGCASGRDIAPPCRPCP